MVSRDVADRGVEEFDHVECGHGGVPLAAESVHQLKQAAGVRRDDGFGVCCEEMFDLAIAQLVRGVGLQEVVNARRAAAQSGLFDFAEFQAGDRGEQLAGLVHNRLRVAEMAGVMVGDAYR